MIKHVMEQVIHIEQYGIISLLIFFLFFTGMLCWTLRLNREFLNTMSQLPLDNESASNQINSANND